MADGDQLTVSSLEDGFTLIAFTKTDGTKLLLRVADSDSNSIGLLFTNSVGQEYVHYSEGDFVIPELKVGKTGDLTVLPALVTPTKKEYDNGDYRGSWATYMRQDENNGLGSLSIPSLRLNLNLNKVHGNFVKKTEVTTLLADKDGLCRSEEEA